MIYINRINNIQIEIQLDVLNIIFDMCKKTEIYEIGGIIIGYYSTDLKKIIITEFTFPPKDSKKGKTWFIRGVEGLEELLNKKWRKNEYYLGEWHFHPNNSPEPSFQDKKQLLSISKSKNFFCPEPIMLIVGGNKKSYIISLNMILNDKFINFFLL